MPYGEEYTRPVDLAADPVMAYLSAEDLTKLIDRRRADMMKAAKEMNFIEAAQIRDEILAMEDKIAQLEKK